MSPRCSRFASRFRVRPGLEVFGACRCPSRCPRLIHAPYHGHRIWLECLCSRYPPSEVLHRSPVRSGILSPSSSDRMTEAFASLFEKAQLGDGVALDAVYKLAFYRLRVIASALLRRERPGHTLQPTALVS